MFTILLRGAVHDHLDFHVCEVRACPSEHSAQVAFALEALDGSDVSEVAHKLAHSVRSEFVLRVRGKVSHRPEGTENSELPTGLFELYADEVEILNESEVIPFMVEDDTDASESLRFRYRYLDLRRPKMLGNLATRYRATKVMRDYLDENGFLEHLSVFRGGKLGAQL